MPFDPPESDQPLPSDDEMAIIKSILLSEQRLQIASLRRLLAELEARGEAARVEWGAELAQVAGKIATELEREQAEIDQHRQRLAALRAALVPAAALAPPLLLCVVRAFAVQPAINAPPSSAIAARAIHVLMCFLSGTRCDTIVVI